MNTPVREGETIGGVPYHAESTLSSAQVLKGAGKCPSEGMGVGATLGLSVALSAQ